MRCGPGRKRKLTDQSTAESLPQLQSSSSLLSRVARSVAFSAGNQGARVRNQSTIAA